MGTCWICGSAATSSEHKIKKSDLIRVHGRGKEFAEASLNYLRGDDSVVILQGPDSKWVKWPDVLCAQCNNSRTQPFDRAYDKFIEYAVNSTRKLIQFSARQHFKTDTAPSFFRADRGQLRHGFGPYAEAVVTAHQASLALPFQAVAFARDWHHMRVMQ